MDFSQEQPLGRKALWFNLLTRCLPIAIMAVVAEGFFADPRFQEVLPPYFAAGFAGFLACALVLMIAVTVLDYLTYRFSLGQYALKIRRGILSIKEITVPYARIQDVHIDRPLIYRVFGLARVVVLTASDKDAANDAYNLSDSVLDLLDRTVAEEMRHELVKRGSVQIVRHESDIK